MSKDGLHSLRSDTIRQMLESETKATVPSASRIAIKNSPEVRLPRSPPPQTEKNYELDRSQTSMAEPPPQIREL